MSYLLVIVIALVLGFFWGSSVTRDRVMHQQEIFNEAKRQAIKA